MPFDNPHQAPVSDIEILVDARRRISGQNSWVKRRFQEGDRHCLVGALSLACGNPDFNRATETERRLARLLVRQMSEKYWWTRLSWVSARTRLIGFNDHPKTTHDDVLAVYDR